jgi:hypothetical protein
MSWFVRCDSAGCQEVGEVKLTRDGAPYCDNPPRVGWLAGLPDGWRITKGAALRTPTDDGLPRHTCPKHSELAT